MKIGIVAVLLLAALSNCVLAADHGFQLVDLIKDIPVREKTENLQFPVEDDKLRFFMIGDYGELDNYFAVRKVGELMNQLAKKEFFEYILTAGDNFYFTGIENIHFRFKPWAISQQFKWSHIKHLPVYATLGNHDCESDFKNEILYHDYNDQWNMPSDYYEFVLPMKDNPEVNFVNLMLNSCKLLCPDNKYDVKGYCNGMNVEPGSEEVKEHYRWLEEKLDYYNKLNTTAWLAVTFHHPPFLQSSMKEQLLPLIRKYGVDFIFVGHEHWSEYTNMDPDYKTRFPEEKPKILKNCTDDTEILVNTTREHTFKKGQTLHQFISGNGGHTLRKICPYMEQDGSVYFKNDGYYGITTVEATSEKVTVTFHRGVEDVVYKIHVES